MRSTTLWTIAIALSCIPLSSTTIATTSSLPAYQCGSDFNAQNYLTGEQDAINHLHTIPTLIDDATIEEVRKFTDKLDGRWHGTGLDFRCFISEDTTRTTIDSFDVDAEIDKHFQGALVMELQQENSEQVNIDRIFLSPSTELDPSLESGLKINTHGQKTGRSSFTVDLSLPGTLVFGEKYTRFIPRPTFDGLTRSLRLGAPFATRLVHEIKTVSLNHSELTVHRDVYVNGKFVSQQQWQLKKL